MDVPAVTHTDDSEDPYGSGYMDMNPHGGDSEPAYMDLSNDFDSDEQDV